MALEIGFVKVKAGDCIEWKAWLGRLRHYAIVLWVGEDAVGLAHNTAPQDKRSMSEYMYEVMAKDKLLKQLSLGIVYRETMMLRMPGIPRTIGDLKPFLLQERLKAVARALFLLSYRAPEYHVLLANCQSTVQRIGSSLKDTLLLTGRWWLGI